MQRETVTIYTYSEVIPYLQYITYLLAMAYTSPVSLHCIEYVRALYIAHMHRASWFLFPT